MKVGVQYFAVLRERRGIDKEEIVTDAGTVEDLIKELVVKFNLGLPTVLIRAAVGTEFVDPRTELKEGMSLILIPPVAGG